MFFTTEDYKKIESWLKHNSKKNSELEYATLPLIGNEVIGLVQDGRNKRVNIKEFVSQLSLLGGTDILNISSKFDVTYIELIEAVRRVPSKYRKLGQIITFLDKEGKWKIYQFIGENIGQWVHTSKWLDVLQDTIVNSYIPDEEDLTLSTPNNKGVSYVQLKDKVYSPEVFSGKGRIFLKKNIITVVKEGVKCKANVLTQDKISTPNTIYIVQYDYDLNGKSLQLPYNCTLKFEGGSISNGSIEFNNTTITSYPIILTKLFPNCIISGNLSEGSIVYDSSSKILKLWDGTVWSKIISTC